MTTFDKFCVVLMLALTAPAAVAIEGPVCRGGDDTGGPSLCLGKCDLDDLYYDVIGYEVRRTHDNWQRCLEAGREFCEVYEMALEESCWGGYGDDDGA